MANLYLVRHGQTEWNYQKRVMGRRPIPLNATGVQQAQGIAKDLKDWPIEKIASSSLLRTKETSQIISDALGLSFKVYDGLIEIGVGEWEGNYWDEMGNDPQLKAFETTPSITRPPGGETLTEVQERAVHTIEEILLEEKPSNLLIVSHADTIRAVIAHYIQMDLDQSRRLQIDNASLSIIKTNPNQGRLTLMNFIANPNRKNIAKTAPKG